MITKTILGVTARRIDELPAAMGGAVRLVRAGLGLEGLRVLCIGSTPSKAYEAPAWTEGR
jgi:hypothetical protein